MAGRAVIVGAGITGTLVARELALAGWSVDLLEARHVGAGSSSRTAAGIRQQFSTPETVRGMRYSVRFYREFGNETSDGVCPIVQNGYLFLHAAEASWSAAKARVQMQHRAGLVEVEALDAAALVDRFPWVSPDLVGGTWCPTDGFLLPEVVYQEAARRAVALGGRLHQNAPVTGARHQGGRLVAVETPKGSFEGDVFVDCTNAWTRRLAPLLGAEDLPVDPLKRYLWFLKRGGPMTAEAVARMPLTITPGGTYCRPENPDTLILGKKHDTAPEVHFDYEDQDRVEPAFSHQSGVDAVPYELGAELAEALPPVAEFDGLAATTAGYYAVTPDHNPFLGYDRQVENLVRLVGFSGHGAMFGPFTARVARALVDAGRNVPRVEIDGEPVCLDAFRIGRDFHEAEVMVI